MMIWYIGYPEYIYNNIFSENNSWNAYVACLLNSDGIETEIIAYIMLQLNRSERSSFIQGLYVEEEYRKKGIAKKLINEAENYSKTMGCKHINAEMLGHLSSFYNKLGYSIHTKITDHKYIISKDLEKTNNIKKHDEGWDR